MSVICLLLAMKGNGNGFIAGCVRLHLCIFLHTAPSTLWCYGDELELDSWPVFAVPWTTLVGFL